MSTDLQSAGVWSFIDNLDDLDLAELATQLPSKMLRSRADFQLKNILALISAANLGYLLQVASLSC